MATEILRPNAAGDETNQEPKDSAPNYGNVDEATPDEDTTYNRAAAGDDKRDLYNLPASSGEETINFIKVYFRCKRAGTFGNAYAYPAIKSDTTVTEGTQITLTSSYATYSQQWNTNPADGQAWEWSDIDALQIGTRLVGGTVREGRCTQVYVEVDYTAGATEKTSSDAGSGVDAYVSLEKTEAKTSSDTGSGLEGTPMHSAILAGSETGSGIEAPVARLLAAFDTGTGAEVGGLLKDLFATELGQGSDSLTAKIETPTKGGGMKLWT